MDYNLAKQLSDAGFPDINLSTATKRVYKSPTLEELTEACGKKFHTLIRVEKGWDACEWVEPFSDKWAMRINGSTPTEAVARLWLALQGSPTAPNTL